MSEIPHGAASSPTTLGEEIMSIPPNPTSTPIRVGLCGIWWCHTIPTNTAKISMDPVSMPAIDEATLCWAIGKRIIGMPNQMVPRTAIQGQSERVTGLRVAGTASIVASPNRRRPRAMAPGGYERRATAMKRNADPKPAAVRPSRNQS